MRSVVVKIHHGTAHWSFRSAFTAQLEDGSDADFSIVATTRGHDTWVAAADAALRLADALGFVVQNRSLVEQRIRKEGGSP